MIVFDLVNDDETDPVYQAMADENLARQYDFLQSLVQAALDLNRPLFTHEIIKALNFHAIACLHDGAGAYRSSDAQVEEFTPPSHTRVASLMNAFVDGVNRYWDAYDAIYLAAFVLWRMCFIHPFANGNGRTARAACYYVLCAKLGTWLAGQPALPDLLRGHPVQYERALRAADASFLSGQLDLTEMYGLISDLLRRQLGAIGQA